MYSLSKFCLAYLLPIAFALGPLQLSKSLAESPIQIKTTKQFEVAPGTSRYHRIEAIESMNPSEVALIICDVWDSHHCVQAVRRVAQVAPRIDKLASKLRDEGATIIHAPSDCMKQYANHPSRKRASIVAAAPDLPTDISSWCDRIPSEESAAYPLDQSDGGEDDDKLEHAQWIATLAAANRNPATPWLMQSPDIQIDSERDYITDSGNQVWNILHEQKIKHVLICGVHTNMCVLGRPFGLRQLANHGKHVLLVRDLTDTMYNPASWPYANHYTGTDLIVDHVERFVCPTTTSDQFLRDAPGPFRFTDDRRPLVAMLIAEDEYETDRTLGPSFRVSLVYGDANRPNHLPGLEQIESANALVVSVRRRPLPKAELQMIRQFVRSGKPVIGIRTASHAFSLRDSQASPGLEQWPEFDREVFGGSYSNHYGADKKPFVSWSSNETNRAQFLATTTSVQTAKHLFQSGGSLYRVSPLAAGTRVLWTGAIDNEASEPVAWTFVRADGGRSFYTSLGHKEDFENIEFKTLLRNAIHWSCSVPTVSREDVAIQQHRYQTGHGKQRRK
jgi:nicotinamidase-related amidase/type 1 glutamine amidotransferase